MLVITNTERTVQQLLAAEITCPDCAGVLGPYGTHERGSDRAQTGPPQGQAASSTCPMLTMWRRHPGAAAV